VNGSGDGDSVTDTVGCYLRSAYRVSKVKEEANCGYRIHIY
jgi:hypothetical protein